MISTDDFEYKCDNQSVWWSETILKFQKFKSVNSIANKRWENKLFFNKNQNHNGL